MCEFEFRTAVSRIGGNLGRDRRREWEANEEREWTKDKDSRKLERIDVLFAIQSSEVLSSNPAP